MKSIALSAALLLSAVMPLSTAVAAPAPAPAPVAAAANQSMIEYLGEVEIGGDIYDVYLVTDLGGGWY
jgi:hypothetical protein